ncbi:hypothetical protein KDH_24650 [Dictyobacter sp. S3.2.2.5]|uniref:Glycosyltransferase RgtA/B/C/D-like domain-containing protein n=1 Tax=Dictyobacter halimunensis TaxID=3026934 RepID=A0ABQ6FMY9_9CHLR|nr:hypothetical protein KDH_24650 [Dictyobacter sp. S3.2.2.5]
MVKKFCAGYKFELCAGLLIICASVLRLFLAYNNWPQLNADEGVMGIMARHIQTGDLPIFFYGQHYMGALEAYLGAGLFRYFGSSTFSLRLGLILLFAIFLACLYMLTARLYTRRFALFILLLLGLGSNTVFSRQLNAIGGYIEILLCSTLSFLLAQQLALSIIRSSASTIWRKGGYLLWGCIVGIGIWSDLLILPVVACSALLLLYFCWAELKRGHVLLVLLGLIIGALPLILYNLHAAPSQDSWSVLIGMQGAPTWSANTMLQQISYTILYSLPAITGNPFCHTDDLPGLKVLGFEPVQSMDPTCIVVRAGWSCIYLVLLLYATILLGCQVWRHFSARQQRKKAGDETLSDGLIRSCTALAITLQAVLTLYSFTRSHAPLDGASVYARYLICLWIALPILLWPLWDFVSKRLIIHKVKDLRVMLIIGLVLVMIISLSYGTYETLSEVPQARAAHQQEEALITALSQHHITHVYTDYWTCYRLAFQSAERITCGVITDDCSFQPDKHNRYQPYFDMTRQDAHAAYLLPPDTSCAPDLQQQGLCSHFTVGAYAVFDAEQICTQSLAFKPAQPFIGNLFF